MKFVWEPDDIRGGRIVRLGSEKWMIGYTGGSGSLKSGTFAMVSLADGMVTMSRVAAEMAVYLTKEGYIPGGWITGQDEGLW